MLQIVQVIVVQRRFKHPRNVPCHQSKSGRKPTDCRICDQVSEPSKRSPSEKWPYDPSSDHLRKPLKEWQCWSTKQQQGRGDSHEQEVLHHVNGEGRIVKRSQRGADGDPNCQDSRKECGKPPHRKELPKRGVQ